MAITEDVDVDHSPLRDVDLVKQLTEITLNRWTQLLWRPRTWTDSSERRAPANRNNASYPHVICQICQRASHDALQCLNWFDNSYQPDNIPPALASLHISNLQEEEWHPNTGATAQITDKPGNLNNLTPYHGSSNVTVGNGEQLQITHVGDRKIGKKLFSSS